MVETGFVGLSLLLVGIGTAPGRPAWRRRSATRDLAQSLTASLLAALVTFAPTTRARCR